MCRLSIIIPNYNKCDFISACLDSLLNQSFRDFEIIISDDCSTDQSAEVIREYAAKVPNLKALFNTERLSVSANRHRAIEASSGEYLTTLDSDDFYFDHRKLELEMKIMEGEDIRNSMEVCAFSTIVTVDESGQNPSLLWSEEVIREGDLFALLFARACMIPRDFIFSRRLYDQVGGYDPAFNLYEDWDLKIRIARRAWFLHTGITGVAYRRSGLGLSAVPVSEHIKVIKAIWNKNQALIKPEESAFIQTRLMNHLQYIEKYQR